MHIQSQSSHHAPLVDDERERGGTHDNDGFVLSAHRERSQGRPRTTSSSQLISQIGLPAASPNKPHVPEREGFRKGRTPVSSPDNAFAYTQGRHFKELLARRAIRHIRTRPYTPRTNGKIERFNQTLQREWAYALEYASSDARRASLPHWINHYNERRTHSALGDRPPRHRVRDVLGLNS
jgi:transposase InsO family protein